MTDAAMISQCAVVDFLTSGEPFGDWPVERIDTHISHVFLAGDRAYKMKRAIKLDFLDYSTLELRLHYCRREIKANQVFAPSLYLRVVPITMEGDGLKLNGPGAPVEWLVEMARFDSQAQFDRMAGRGALSISMIEQLADCIAGAHQLSERRPDQGQVRLLRFFRTYVGKTLLRFHDGGRDIHHARCWVVLIKRELARRAAGIEARRRHGFVRRFHGDLHLANICLFNDRPTPFDAIEFNDDIACGDVLYDLAYTIMDLIHFDLRDRANQLLNRYLAHTRDYGGLRVLPVFLSLRAAIRAMAVAMGPPSDDRVGTVERLERLAVAFLDKQPKPRLIALGGLSGTGKSTLAAALGPEIAGNVGAVVLRSDLIRKHDYGVLPEQPLSAEAYWPEARERVYVEMMNDARRALRAGLTVILDATFLDEHDRQAAADLAVRITGDAIAGVWLTAPLQILRDRLASRGPDASDATVDVLERQATRDPGHIVWKKVDVSGSVNQSLARVSDTLASIDRKTSLDSDLPTDV